MNKREATFEHWNFYTHLIGVILGIIFAFLLIHPAIRAKDPIKIVSFSIYSFCFILLFLSSSIYHITSNKKVKRILRIFDHVSIYFFIAGSYTAVLMNVLTGWLRILTMSIIWACVIIGTSYKIFTYKNYDKYKGLSTLLYVIMGWLALFIIKPILSNTSIYFLLWIIAGGLLYTLGTYFYKSERFYYNHVIWHFFVLIAAVCHFIGIYFYLR
ncbi:MAG: hemolysin III family protein [Gallicola sp.]|nr:hemolysin III family protein [Gallicola sp.]